MLKKLNLKKELLENLLGLSHQLAMLAVNLHVEHPASDHFEVLKQRKVAPFLRPGVDVQITCKQKITIILETFEWPCPATLKVLQVKAKHACNLLQLPEAFQLLQS